MEHVNAEILRAIADGKKVQYSSVIPKWLCSVHQYGHWEDFDSSNIEACWNLLTSSKLRRWRIAPKTIMIGEHEVPEPCREPLERGTVYWSFTPFMGMVRSSWCGSKADFNALKSGFVHLTEEAAEQHYEAITNLFN